MTFLAAGFLSGIPDKIHAQKRSEAKVWLTDGTLIKGKVFESFDGTTVKIRIDTCRPISISIYKISKLIYQDEEGTHLKTLKGNYYLIPNTEAKNHTFYHEFMAGQLFGEENTSVTVHSVNGYQFARLLAPGLGIGFDRYGSYRTAPIYLHLKGYVLNRTTSPFLFTDLGYGFAWYKNTDEEAYGVTDVRGGFYWQAGLGCRINYARSAMLVTVGYKNQTASLSYVFDQQQWVGIAEDPAVDVSEKRILRRVAVTIGILF